MKYNNNLNFPFNIEWVAEVLGLIDERAKYSGSELSCHCPFPDCNDKKTHLDINITNNVFNCTHCGRSGGMLSLYAQVMNVDTKTAARELYEIWEGKHPKIEKPKFNPAKKIENYAPFGEDAPIHLRNKAYTMILEDYCNTLSEEHKSNLLKRGLTEKAIEENGYKTIPRSYTKQGFEVFGDAINCTENVAGFYTEDSCRYINTDIGGILIPFRDIDRNIGMMQIRTSGSPKYIALSSGRNKTERKDVAKAVSTIHFVGIDKNNPPKEVFLTEGALKADVAHCIAPKMPFIAMAGVNNRYGLKEATELLKSLGVEAIVLTFDMDWFVKPGVQRGLAATKELLASTGMKVKYLQWHTEEEAKKYVGVSKDDNGNELNYYGELIKNLPEFNFYKGIDDYLLGKKIR